jgi:hypothetical protein
MCVANGCAVDKSAGGEPFGPLRRAPTLAHERFGLKWRDFFFAGGLRDKRINAACAPAAPGKATLPPGPDRHQFRT